MNIVTFITTCKGRLAQLQRSLPQMLAQPDAEVVVVDYDCPEHCGDWVASTHPDAKVVRETRPVRFNASRARNLGAAAATSEWLCFIDADISPHRKFLASLLPSLKPGCYLHGTPLVTDKYGTFLCRRQDFDRIGGYDEVFDAWSQEDKDVYLRLEWAGLQRRTFDNDLLQAEQHSDTLRTQFFGTTDRWQGMRLNAFYLHAKLDLMRLTGGPLEPAVRQALYDEIRRAVENSLTPHIDIELPAPPRGSVAPGVTLARRLSFTLLPDSGANGG
ncbi:MAG: glycosyltransferase [Sulfuritalea sp.]|nr:glycosyltransferase [Sulfuritalea sp.]